MISGFNTDIKVGETVYHVQTEDKGLKARLILSLVYDKGTILASKRAPYDEGIDAKELADRVNRQHQLICAAINAGRIEDLKKLAAKSAAARTEPQPQTPAPEPAVAMPIGAPSQVETVPSGLPSLPVSMPSTPIDQEPDDNDMMSFEQIFDAVTIVDEDELILEAEAVEVVSELSGRERTSNNKLSIELLGEAQFKGGERHTVNLMICRGTDRKVIPGAEIMIKVLGSMFRPVIFHARTDANGLAKVHLQLPQFDAGRAALLVRAIAGGEEVELRKIVTPR